MKSSSKKSEMVADSPEKHNDISAGKSNEALVVVLLLLYQ
jgi:hypothetical protein